ncbi:magnesium-protoporphyrin IX monomethyl ester anaerobic oxidative cyclase [Rhodobacteraceae bacterium NNCM2]|nr:magnesium-protoporphyrin IX monomethyl ester anaerobic oxidative cyclase [Coraliihabitans acroporae]
MRIVLLHPPHTAIGSRVPRENLPPLGLLSIAGPLIDAGHDVSLVNADPPNWPIAEIIARVVAAAPEVILIGHSGSTTAHPTILEIVAALRKVLPDVTVIYGGVYPTYHWRDVLEEAPGIDLIVRGEGEETTLNAISAIESDAPLANVCGIAFRGVEGPIATRPAAMIKDLDQHRIAWELIDFADYSYWGGKRAVVLQFSRGCPHLCTYCGQRGFWTQWRHRDPVKFAAEIAWLHREHGVELINLADENPTSSRRQWRAFLEALIAEDVPVIIIGSTRAGDIVRDADLMPLYKRAGVLRFLLGLESTDEATLTRIKKGAKTNHDKQAIRLLRAHDMIGLCTFAIGFDLERDRDYLRILRQLLDYDPDQIMSIFATPHRWTPFFEETKELRVIQTDLRLWDYKHQVTASRHVPAWRAFIWVKLIEMRMQLRPKALWRTFFHPAPEIRHAMQWYTRMGRKVTFREMFQFVFQERRRPNGPTVAEFLGGSTAFAEEALDRPNLAKTRFSGSSGSTFPQVPSSSG